MQCTFMPRLMLNVTKANAALTAEAVLIAGVRKVMAYEIFPESETKAAPAHMPSSMRSFHVFGDLRGSRGSEPAASASTHKPQCRMASVLGSVFIQRLLTTELRLAVWTGNSRHNSSTSRKNRRHTGCTHKADCRTHSRSLDKSRTHTGGRSSSVSFFFSSFFLRWDHGRENPGFCVP